jgi:hypothetical protein
MRKTHVTILTAIVLLTATLHAQSPQTADPDVDAFDRQVAGMRAIPRPLTAADVDVVGLEIGAGSAEATQLARVAEAGSGHYFPVANALDLSRVFTQVTTGIGGGGGGGRFRRGSSLIDWPLVLGVFFLLGSLLLVIGMLLIRQKSAAAAAGVRTHALLDITYPGGETKRLEMRGTTTIGRGQRNALVLPDDQASSSHAVIEVTPDGFLLRDLGSTNGTWLNGTRISEQWLYIGDRIQIGSIVLTFGA